MIKKSLAVIRNIVKLRMQKNKRSAADLFVNSRPDTRPGIQPRWWDRPRMPPDVVA
jgi:hypothetical protein